MADQLFEWKEYLEVAQVLAESKQEARLRSSISRAYYCVYNLAFTRAKQNGFVSVPGGSTHVQLWRLFSLSPEAECTRLGQIAIRLKEKREKADYGPIYKRIEEDVDEVLKEAHDFVARLGRLAARHPKPDSVRR